MYFYKLKGKQILDLRGNLILSHNTDIVRTRTKNNGPRHVVNGRSIKDIPNLKFFRKIRATWAAARFIWGKSQAMNPRAINDKNRLSNKGDK